VKPRLLVTGASGFLGWNLCQEARAAWDVLGVVHQGDAVPPGVALLRADLLDERARGQLLATHRPDAVVHLAAMANTGVCERDPAGTRLLNVDVPAQLAGLCAERRLPFAFASTDMVFAGTAAPYAETDRPDPICEYGRQKATAEERVLDSCPTALVCRLPLMFGEPSPRSGSFLSGLVRNLKEGNPVRLFTDEFRTPAEARCVARGILGLLGHASGVYHLGGPARISRYDLGLLTARHFGLDPANLVPTKQCEIPLACPRPPDVSLDSTRARLLGFSPLPPSKALQHLAPKFLTET
jgi:dTDP-4-dehydrorhamnose reductase